MIQVPNGPWACIRDRRVCRASASSPGGAGGEWPRHTRVKRVGYQDRLVECSPIHRFTEPRVRPARGSAFEEVDQRPERSPGVADGAAERGPVVAVFAVVVDDDPVEGGDHFKFAERASGAGFDVLAGRLVRVAALLTTSPPLQFPPHRAIDRVGKRLSRVGQFIKLFGPERGEEHAPPADPVQSIVFREGPPDEGVALEEDRPGIEPPLQLDRVEGLNIAADAHDDVAVGFAAELPDRFGVAEVVVHAVAFGRTGRAIVVKDDRLERVGEVGPEALQGVEQRGLSDARGTGEDEQRPGRNR